MLQDLSLRLDLTARYLSNMLKQPRADLFDRLSAFNDVSRGHVQIARHPLKDSIIRRKLYHRSNGVSDRRTVPGREHDHRRSRSDEPGSRLLIVSRPSR